VSSTLCARRQLPSGTAGVGSGGNTSHAMRMEVAQSNVDVDEWTDLTSGICRFYHGLIDCSP
jgi:hypothetical protein